MKNLVKHLISIMLCAVLTLSLVPTTIKAQDNNTYIVQKAYSFMQIAMSDSDAYGLVYSDDNFYISQCIPAYTLNDGIVSMSDKIKFYFILEDERPIAELTVISEADDIAPSIQFSTNLSNSYQSYDKETFTIVLGEKNPYFTELGETDSQLSSVEFIGNTNSNVSISMSSSMSISTSSSYPAGYSVSLPFKPNSYGLCWAASVASVGQNITGDNYSATAVADIMDIDYNAGGSCVDMANSLITVYNLSASVAGGIFITQSVADILMSGGGIIAFCKPSPQSNDAHAVGINGYSANSSGCYYSIMDPNKTAYSMMTSGTDSVGNSTYCFYFNGLGTFYWYDSVYCF